MTAKVSVSGVTYRALHDNPGMYFLQWALLRLGETKRMEVRMGLRLSRKEEVKAGVRAHLPALRPGHDWQCADALGTGWAEASSTSLLLRARKERSPARGEVIVGSWNLRMARHTAGPWHRSVGLIRRTWEGAQSLTSALI